LEEDWLHMHDRPRDFYGPEDWDGHTDPQEQEDDVKKRQAAWDAQRAMLPWWRKLFK